MISRNYFPPHRTTPTYSVSISSCSWRWTRKSRRLAWPQTLRAASESGLNSLCLVLGNKELYLPCTPFLFQEQPCSRHSKIHNAQMQLLCKGRWLLVKVDQMGKSDFFSIPTLLNASGKLVPVRLLTEHFKMKCLVLKRRRPGIVSVWSWMETRSSSTMQMTQHQLVTVDDRLGSDSKNEPKFVNFFI